MQRVRADDGQAQRTMERLTRVFFPAPPPDAETIPPSVRDQITAMLHDFVVRNVEDA